LVSLVVEGPEMEALGSVKRGDSWRAKTPATRVIREMLERAGANARDLRIPRLKAKLPRDVTVGVRVGEDRRPNEEGFQGRRVQKLKINREDSWWGPPSQIADAIDRDLFGDGSGVLVLASRKSRPTHKLETRHLLSPVGEKPLRDGEGPNVWIGLGHDPQGPRERVQDRVELPKKHPSSSHSQRWNSTGRDVIETVENKHWRKKADVTRALKRLRDKAMREQVTYEVEALPVIPWIRPNALVNVPVAGGRANARAAQWDLPLGPGAEPLRIGVNRRRGWQR
jgi:hypothetical protein